METTTQEQIVTTETQAVEASLSQKDAVYQFAAEALEKLGGNPVNPGQPLRDRVSKEVRKAIRVKLFEGIKAGTIKVSRQMDDSKLKKYCSSLINNWLKKDQRFSAV